MNEEPLTYSEISMSGMSKRRSGLSEPYLSIAVSQSMRSNGTGISRSMAFLKSSLIMPSIIVRMSSWLMKLISMSSCVNSG